MTTNTAPRTQQELLEAWNADWRDRFPSGYIASEREHNGYHDSYFYETVYDDATGTWEQVSTGSTAYGTPAYSTNLPWLRNAPQEVRDRAIAAKRKQTYEYLIRSIREQAKAWIQSTLAERSIPQMGDTVRSLRKAKDTPKGTVGTVTWKGEDQYNGGARYGVTTANGERFFINARSVELVSSANEVSDHAYEVNEAGVESLAREWADHVAERHIFTGRVAFALGERDIEIEISRLVVTK